MDPNSEDLFEMLRLAQHLGFLGAAPIERVVAQGRLFSSGLVSVEPGGRVVDLGSGGGSPALVVATARPDLLFTLIDRRRKRTDFLMRATRRLELRNVEVVCEDVNRLSAEVAGGARPPFDGLTARGFGPFPLLVRSIVELVRPGGVAVVSDPTDSTRWFTRPVDPRELRLVERLESQDGIDGGIATLARI